MSFIYKITNKINGKSYIGKTNLTVEKRYKEHLAEAKNKRCLNRPLYNAIRKHGESSFSIEILEEVALSEDAPIREIYYIELYNTFRKGYNATKGGEGKVYLDYEAIINSFQDTNNAAETARIMDCNVDSVYSILTSKGIKRDVRLALRIKEKEVVATKGGLTLSFKSTFDAANYLIRLGGSSLIIDSHRVSILRVCRGKRSTYLGFCWKFIN